MTNKMRLISKKSIYIKKKKKKTSCKKLQSSQIVKARGRKKERNKKTETLSTREKRAYNNGRKSLDVSLQTLDQSNI